MKVSYIMKKRKALYVVEATACMKEKENNNI